MAKDYQQAKRYYTEAAKKGNKHGQFHLGLIYEKGLGTEVNYHKASKWYKKSSDQNHPTALNNLGWCTFLLFSFPSFQPSISPFHSLPFCSTSPFLPPFLYHPSLFLLLFREPFLSILLTTFPILLLPPPVIVIFPASLPLLLAIHLSISSSPLPPILPLHLSAPFSTFSLHHCLAFFISHFPSFPFASFLSFPIPFLFPLPSR